ncbi:MAG TPA: nucleoside monophosphate kinase [Thermoanaerobaculia bacterium]|nr:nucleoside monophosphate kinase [Thermoanaerobaculia bacterium]
MSATIGGPGRPTKLAVFLLGRAGAGKTWLASLLVERLRFHLISGGSLLRSVASSESGELARQARTAIDTGGTLTDEVILQLYGTEIRRVANARKCFDGNPRDLQQFTAICSLLGTHGYDSTSIVGLYVHLDQSVARQRRQARRICSNCGLQTTLEECPGCRARTLPRADDCEANVVLERERWFSEDVTPILALLADQAALVTIDNARPRAEVQDEVLSAIVSRLEEAGGGHDTLGLRRK